MVKPALPYLDVIQDAAQLAPDHPLACYQVSGEYAMVCAGAAAGVYDLRAMAFETSESMVRAGEFSRFEQLFAWWVFGADALLDRCNTHLVVFHAAVLGLVG